MFDSGSFPSPWGERVSNEREAALQSVAARQFGVLTRGQLLSLGVGARTIDRWTSSGRLLRLHRGVYATASHPASWGRSVLAGVLACGPGAVASGRTAARLADLEGTWGDKVCVLVPGRRWPRPPGVDVRRTLDLPAIDIRRAAIPTTTIARTLIELAADVRPLDLEIALDDAIRRGLVDASDVLGRLDALGSTGRRGTAALRRMLDVRHHGPTADSGGEIALSRLLVDRGLPPPVARFRVHDRRSAFVAEVDLAYPDLRVALEFDGYRFHTGRLRWERDVQRENALLDLGWTVRRFSAADLRRPRRTAETVRTAMAQAAAAAQRSTIAPKPAIRGGQPRKGQS